jgi:hypothetical protein
VIDRTMVDEQNQLGVVLDSSVTPDKVPDPDETGNEEDGGGIP